MCEKSGSSHYVGYWNNCRDHIASKGHQRAENKEQKPTEDPSGEYDQEENKIDNEDEVQIESPLTLTPTTKAELDLTFAKFILPQKGSFFQLWFP